MCDWLRCAASALASRSRARPLPGSCQVRSPESAEASSRVLSGGATPARGPPGRPSGPGLQERRGRCGHPLQGYPPTIPGSTTSTAGPSPAILPTLSWSWEAVPSAGLGCWKTASPSWASSWPSSCSPSGSSAVLP
ncbi:BRI3 isoform 1 [Pongo abelii]|uniref:BRI3 isoform 1 n=1 Tax=Pongo abelii TaxID=9601 RepID=A0A2J8RU75_PONAB|nr:BRI3 isoform 1 [Pongo abelii]